MENELDIKQVVNESKGRLPARNHWYTLAVFAFMVMEITWIALWFNLLIYPENRIDYLRAFIVLGLVMVGIYYAVWIMNTIGLNLLVSRLILFLLLLIGAFVGLEMLSKSNGIASLGDLLRRTTASFRAGSFVPDATVIVGFTLFVSWRAVTLASRQLQPGRAVGGFRTGILLFLGYALLLPKGQIEQEGAFYLFLFSGLLAMSLTRIAYVGQVKGGHQLPYNWRWLIGIIFSILVLMSIAVFLGRVTNGQRLDYILWLFSWIGYGLMVLISPLLWFAIRGMYWVFEHINLDKILEALASAFQAIMKLIDAFAVVIRIWIFDFQRNSLQAIFSFFERSRPLIFLGSILLISIFIVLVMRRFRQGRDEFTNEDYDSLLVQQDLFKLLKDALRKGLDRMLEGIEKAFHLQAARRLLAAARIRRIYARLMKLSARLDNPRPPSCTPIEFLDSLNRLFPTLNSELEAVTFMYVKIRYGEQPEPSEEIDLVEQAWRRISQKGREMIRESRKGIH